ncbi:hypothetical protein CEXT_749291 [Caerostris extrusa]|uniref:Uncharacterized protein n=1 Tax=Caerostris extrusa TaxID=172846 RepID=A0AAV4Y7V7_CAEEX|nr:hypothetical protein CEXT_749291 [Caerostris extrusa]
MCESLWGCKPLRISQSIPRWRVMLARVRETKWGDLGGCSKTDDMEQLIMDKDPSFLLSLGYWKERTDTGIFEYQRLHGKVEGFCEHFHQCFLIEDQRAFHCDGI